MSKIFQKGNNFVRQLAMSTKPKELAWTELKGFDVGNPVKIECNTAQTAILNDQGKICYLIPRRALLLGLVLRRKFNDEMSRAL